MRVLVVCDSFSNNQLARVHSLWLLLRLLEHEVDLVTVVPGETWPPLRASPMMARAEVIPVHELDDRTAAADVVLSVKVRAVSLGLAAAASRRTGTPLLADIDDPDLETSLLGTDRSRRARGKHLARSLPHLSTSAALALTARRAPSIVSNPVLQRRWGGTVLPHTCVDLGAGALHETTQPVVAFVGTLWGHKGLKLLRAGIARLADQGWRLVATADPPPDAAPWEDWRGPGLPIDEAQKLVANADVVALPSEPYGYGTAQLPMKLLEAMLCGRAVAVSRVGPMPWALGPGGVVFPPGSVDALVAALRPLADPELRSRLGNAARAEALSRYTPEVLAPVLQASLERSVSS